LTSKLWRRYVPVALFAVLWLDLIRLLSTQWEAREQYAYGWFVPFFAAALLWRRWLDRPIPGGSGQQSEITHSSSTSFPSVGTPAPHRSSHFLLSAFCFLLLLLLLPLRVIFEINTDWPLIAWLYTLIVVALTLYAFYLADPSRTSDFRPLTSGSLVSPWVKHFFFPVCFILVAVVWPYRIEKGLTQGLMRVVASITVELLGWLDIPALQRGNLIELGSGTLGIDEACSGIRSFQSTLMAGLFMGELYRLRLLPRAALVLIGLVLAFCFNVVRTLILSYQANQQGLGAIDKWHDPAGFTIAVACFFCLWALAVVLTKWSAKKAETTRHESPTMPPHPAAGPSYPEPVTLAAPKPGEGGSPFYSLLSAFCFPTCRRYLLALGCWSLLIIAFTHFWYEFRGRNRNPGPRWAAVLPTQKADFKNIELPPRSLRLLRHDSGATGSWTEDDGTQWALYFLRWEPKSITSIFRARQHRPDVCLPAAGLKLVENAGRQTFDAHGLLLPFEEYTYQSAGKLLHVFFCQWEDGARTQSGLADTEQGGRVKAAWDGHKHLGQQSLELILTGYKSLADAEQALRRRLPTLIRVDSPPATAQATDH